MKNSEVIKFEYKMLNSSKNKSNYESFIYILLSFYSF